jgi:hypothetical protein
MEDGFVTEAAEGRTVLNHQYHLQGSANKARTRLLADPTPQ